MNTETKACPMCGETILAVAKKCKHCQEYLEINDESSKSNESSKSSIYGKIKSNVSRLVNTNKANEVNKANSIYRVIKENENVTFGGIKKSLHIKLPELEEILSGLIESNLVYKHESGGEVVYSAEGNNQRHEFSFKFKKESYRVYSFIKKYRTVRIAHIKKSLSIDNLEIEKIVNNLVANGDICKNNINNEVCCSINEVNQKHTPGDDKSNGLKESRTQHIDNNVKSFLARFPEYDANYEIYKYIKKSGNVTLRKISAFVVNHLDVKEEYVENILDDLIHHNIICININIHDLDKTTYSVEKNRQKYKLEMNPFRRITNAKRNQTKTLKTLAKEDINDIEIDDPEVMQIINMKPLPDIPEKIDINGTENNVELHSEELPDDIKNNLPNEDESKFDIDKYMSEEDDSNHN
jgi:hypothetical protein